MAAARGSSSNHASALPVWKRHLAAQFQEQASRIRSAIRDVNFLVRQLQQSVECSMCGLTVGKGSAVPLRWCCSASSDGTAAARCAADVPNMCHACIALGIASFRKMAEGPLLKLAQDRRSHGELRQVAGVSHCSGGDRSSTSATHRCTSECPYLYGWDGVSVVDVLLSSTFLCPRCGGPQLAKCHKARFDISYNRRNLYGEYIPQSLMRHPSNSGSIDLSSLSCRTGASIVLDGTAIPPTVRFSLLRDGTQTAIGNTITLFVFENQQKKFGKGYSGSHVGDLNRGPYSDHLGQSIGSDLEESFKQVERLYARSRSRWLLWLGEWQAVRRSGGGHNSPKAAGSASPSSSPSPTRGDRMNQDGDVDDNDWWYASGWGEGAANEYAWAEQLALHARRSEDSTAAGDHFKYALPWSTTDGIFRKVRRRVWRRSALVFNKTLVMEVEREFTLVAAD